MNRKLIAVTLAVLLIVSISACTSEGAKTTTITEPTKVTIPGLAEFDGKVDLDDGPNNSTEGTQPVTDKDSEESSAPTNGKDEEENTKPTTGKSEQETTNPTTGKDNQEATNPNTPVLGGNGLTAYESYQAMSGAEQKAFMDSFSSMEAFFAWLNAAKAEYDALNPEVGVGDGSIDLGGNG